MRLTHWWYYGLCMWLQEIIANESLSSEERDFGRLALNAYSFPVESLVIDPQANRVTHAINANELLDAEESGISGMMWVAYTPSIYTHTPCVPLSYIHTPCVPLSYTLCTLITHTCTPLSYTHHTPGLVMALSHIHTGLILSTVPIYSFSREACCSKWLL